MIVQDFLLGGVVFSLAFSPQRGYYYVSIYICIEAENPKREITINSVGNIVLFGRVKVIPAVVMTCVQNGISLTWLSTKGKFWEIGINCSCQYSKICF